MRSGLSKLNSALAGDIDFLVDVMERSYTEKQVGQEFRKSIFVTSLHFGAGNGGGFRDGGLIVGLIGVESERSFCESES